MATAAPTISVVTPTYKRPQLLERAVRSVQGQTRGDWELILSDDEDPPGETWQLAQRLAASDLRIRAVRNPGPHGQSGNVNHAMRHARGDWIKPLYDDDALHPECLGAFAAAVRDRASVALATCLLERFRDGAPVKHQPRGGRALLELVEGRLALLGMYLQDIDVGMPTQVMVRRSVVVEHGAYFEEAPGILALVDSLWYARVLRHGDLLFLNRPLVEEHQGSHATATSQTTEAMYDRELVRFRELLRSELDVALCPPSPVVIDQQLRLIRAMHRLHIRQPLQALKLAAGAWHPQAWYLAGRWLLRRRFPGRFYAVPRVPLDS